MVSLLADVLSSVAANAVLFLSVPLVWWVVAHRKKVNFFAFVGFVMPARRSPWWVFVVFAVGYLVLSFAFFRVGIRGEWGMHETNQVYQFVGMGVAALLPGLILNFVANGLLEEAFFRGFLLKRLAVRLGTWPAIVIQGVLFGLLHSALLLMIGFDFEINYYIVAFLGPTIFGMLMGILNEKLFDGRSVIPSVLLHGAGNFVVTVWVAFTL